MNNFINLEKNMQLSKKMKKNQKKKKLSNKNQKSFYFEDYLETNKKK